MQDILTPELQIKLDELLKHHSNNAKEKNMITNAFMFAVKHHEGQKRKSSGEPYVYHPIFVATYLCKSMKADYETICAALLHDTLEDCPGVTKQLLEKEFTPTIAKLVDGVTKISPKGTDDTELSTINKLFLSIEDDPRIIIIKLIDRLHNMRTINGLHGKKKMIFACQTEQIFVPIARLLSMYNVKEELEENCFRAIEELCERDNYTSLKSERSSKYENEEFLEFFEAARDGSLVSNILEKDDCREKIRIVQSKKSENVDVKFMPFCQIYNKLNSGRYSSMDEIADLVKIKINLKKVEDIPRAIEQFVEEYGEPLYIKDYITTPVFNGYQSIHTAFYVPDANRNIQFEFRTFEMKKRAEFGIASCWNYDFEDIRERMLETLATLPFYEDLKELCQIYRENEKKNPKNHVQNEIEFNQGLVERIFTRRIKVTFNGEVHQTYDSRKLGSFLKSKYPEYLDGTYDFICDSSFIDLDQSLKNEMVIKTAEKKYAYVMQREMK